MASYLPIAANTSEVSYIHRKSLNSVLQNKVYADSASISH